MHSPFFCAAALGSLLAALHMQPPAKPEAPDLGGPQRVITGDSLMAIVRELPAQRAPRPTAEHVAGLRKTEELLIARVRAMGFEPTLPDIHWSKRPAPPEPGLKDGAPAGDEAKDAPRWRNIVFELAPRAEKPVPNELIIIGAHFDAVPQSPGADDNGSGTAALLEIARALKDVTVRRPIRFALFNLEEAGLVGSTQYVQTLAEVHDAAKAAGEKVPTVTLMLSLEMLGFYSSEKGSQTNPFPAFKLGVPETGDFIGLGTVLKHRRAVRTLAAEMLKAEPACKVFVMDHSPIAPPDLLRSDHAPFLLRGMPGIIVTDTANFRNKHYHQPTDTPETLDAERFAVTVRALAGAIHAMAGPQGEADPVAPAEADGKPAPKP